MASVACRTRQQPWSRLHHRRVTCSGRPITRRVPLVGSAEALRPSPDDVELVLPLGG